MWFQQRTHIQYTAHRQTVTHSNINRLKLEERVITTESSKEQILHMVCIAWLTFSIAIPNNVGKALKLPRNSLRQNDGFNVLFDQQRDKSCCIWCVGSVPF